MGQRAGTDFHICHAHLDEKRSVRTALHIPRRGSFPNKICENRLLSFEQTHTRLFRSLATCEQIGHISGQRAHDLQTLEICPHLSAICPMNHVPVLR